MIMLGFNCTQHHSIRRALLAGACSFSWALLPLGAAAADYATAKPSVEVNLGALRQLRESAQPQISKPAPMVPAAPVAASPKPAPRPMPVPDQSGTIAMPPPAPLMAPPAPAQQMQPQPVPVAAPAPAPRVIEPLKPLPMIPESKPVVQAPVAPAPVMPAVEPLKPLPVMEAPKLPPAPVVEAPVPSAPMPSSPVVMSQPKYVVPTAPQTPAAPPAASNEGLRPGAAVSIPLVSSKQAADSGRKPVSEALAPMPEPAPVTKPKQTSKSEPAPTTLSELPKFEAADKPSKATAEKTVQKPISTSPMMVPVPEEPKPLPPALPPSVMERVKKTFGNEDKPVGVVKDLKTIKNTAEEKALNKAKELAAKKSLSKVPANAPFQTMPPVPKNIDEPHEGISAPIANVDGKALPPVMAEAPTLAAPALPELPAAEPKEKAEPAAKVAEMAPLPAIKPEPAPTKAEPVAKKDTSGVLPAPMPPLPLPAAKPVSAPTKSAGAEKLPPAELPLPPLKAEAPAVEAPKAEAKPIVLPKTEIAALPKMDTKPQAAKALPELPNPPAAEAKLPLPAPEVKADAAKATTPAKEEPKTGVLALPPLPAPGEKPALPPLNAIIGDKRPSSADVVQPKDAISAAPLMVADAGSKLPALPKFPVDGAASAAAKTPELPPLPAAGVKMPSAEAKPTQAMPPLPAVKAGDAKAPELPPLPAAKPTVVAALPAPDAKPAGDAEKASQSLNYAKGKSDLSADAKSELSALAQKVKGSQGSVRIVAYASGTAEESSVARRTSNARALQIRAFLIDKGVNAESINVQAFGNKVPEDRADIFVK
jgi:outer membrane protein OmpA-like peptidoglycan-associated protein